MAITRKQFNEINDRTEVEILAALRKGRGALEEILFDELEDANQALEEAIEAGTADDSDKTRLDRAKKLHDRAVATGDPTLAQRASKALRDAAAALRAKIVSKTLDFKPVAASEPDAGEDDHDDVTKPATELAELNAKVNTLVGLVDQTAAAATKSHDNVLAWGFTMDRDANGKPVPGKDSWADFIETSTTDHTMTLHGEDGQSGLVKDVENLKAERKLSWWPTVAVLIVAFILFWIPLAAGWGAIWAGVAGTAAVIVALITFIATNSNRS